MHETYFAASNSGAGFVSYYPALFDARRFARLYLIKGGPGTGKSSLMRRVAAEAEARGMGVRRYACSSDPDSLDGIVVGDNRFAMLDATAPHTQDTVLPGAGDEICDLGRFWDAGRLSAARDEIIALNERKKFAYARAYGWLRGVQAVDRSRRAMLERCVDLPKLRRAALRCLRGTQAGEGHASPALIDSIGMRGRVYFDTMQADSSRAYLISGARGGDDLFLREVAALCRERKLDVELAYAPIEPTQLSGLHLVRENIAFVAEDCAAEKRPVDRVVNMARFWREGELRKLRAELRGAAKCRAQLMAGAELAFADARETHFAIEQIYIAAMDFGALDDYCAGLIDRIFARE